MKRTLTATLLAIVVAVQPAFAIVDDGSGCGCLRPCFLAVR